MNAGSVLITGPTGALGRATVLAAARRPAGERPDLLLVGRPGDALQEVAGEARRQGATAYAIGADLARLADVRAAATRAGQLLANGAVRPLRALIANAGVSVLDTRGVSADGYELTFAVNHLAHARLIGDLLDSDSFSPGSRIILLGSNTYYSNAVRRVLRVPAAEWRDPVELATPTSSGRTPSAWAGGVAYSNSKLAIIYYAHELQRRVGERVNVTVFEPGFMPGTGLAREHGAGMRRVGRVLQRIPGISSPRRSGPMLASVALDDRWGRLRDGAFVVKTKPRAVEPFAYDRDREARLWEATEQLLARAAQDDAGSAGSAGSARTVPGRE